MSKRSGGSRAARAAAAADAADTASASPTKRQRTSTGAWSATRHDTSGADHDDNDNDDDDDENDDDDDDDDDDEEDDEDAERNERVSATEAQLAALTHSIALKERLVMSLQSTTTDNTPSLRTAYESRLSALKSDLSSLTAERDAVLSKIEKSTAKHSSAVELAAERYSGEIGKVRAELEAHNNQTRSLAERSESISEIGAARLAALETELARLTHLRDTELAEAARAKEKAMAELEAARERYRSKVNELNARLARHVHAGRALTRMDALRRASETKSQQLTNELDRMRRERSALVTKIADEKRGFLAERRSYQVERKGILAEKRGILAEKRGLEREARRARVEAEGLRARCKRVEGVLARRIGAVRAERRVRVFFVFVFVFVFFRRFCILVVNSSLLTPLPLSQSIFNP
jgi:chromosome segregation ATPase